jgi:methyl-accepting chemotaxis protein
MFNFLKRVLILVILLAIAFISLSVYSGGDHFRWMGHLFKRGTEEAAETADLIKESSDNIKKTTGETVDAVKKTGKQIKDTTEKVSRTVKKTADGIKDTADGASEAVKGTGEKIMNLTESDDKDH